MISRNGQAAADLLGILNGTDLSLAYAEATGKPTPPIIAMVNATEGPAPEPACWTVFRPEVDTDPGAVQYGGQKTFRIENSLQNDLDRAKRWAAGMYGVTGWDKAHLNVTYWAPAEVVRWLKAELRKAAAALLQS